MYNFKEISEDEFFSNKLRGAINRLFREDILALKSLEYPNFNEKIICRRNNWTIVE